MGRQIVISMSVIESADDREPPTSFTKGFMCETRRLEARDDHDNLYNVERLASQMVYEMFRRMIAGEPCLPPDVGNAVAESSAKAVELLRQREDGLRVLLPQWLRMRAAELTGFTLYHPEHTLEGWAKRIEEGELIDFSTYKETRGAVMRDDAHRMRAAGPNDPPAVCLMMLSVPPGEFLDFAHCDKCDRDRRRDCLFKTDEYRMNPASLECVQILGPEHSEPSWPLVCDVKGPPHNPHEFAVCHVLPANIFVTVAMSDTHPNSVVVYRGEYAHCKAFEAQKSEAKRS